MTHSTYVHIEVLHIHESVNLVLSHKLNTFPSFDIDVLFSSFLVFHVVPLICSCVSPVEVCVDQWVSDRERERGKTKEIERERERVSRTSSTASFKSATRRNEISILSSSCFTSSIARS